jgi:hypothetical protein
MGVEQRTEAVDEDDGPEADLRTGTRAAFAQTSLDRAQNTKFQRRLTCAAG